MSFEEFEYICLLSNDQHAEITMQTYILRSIIRNLDLVNLFQCKDYLKTHRSLEETRDMLEVVIHPLQDEELSDRRTGCQELKIENKTMVWEWQILNTILFSFPIEHLISSWKKKYYNMEVYKTINIAMVRMTILLKPFHALSIQSR